jgi:ribonucleotide monophosphatase NagD (HAD superfamily)
MSPIPSTFSSHFSTVAPNYDVLLSDVWGVVHNGVAATANACEALRRFRAQGGTVVLITNAPRPGEVVARFTLDRLGVSRAAYDGIISSGAAAGRFRATLHRRSQRAARQLRRDRELRRRDARARA